MIKELGQASTKANPSWGTLFPAKNYYADDPNLLTPKVRHLARVYYNFLVQNNASVNVPSVAETARQEEIAPILATLSLTRSIIDEEYKYFIGEIRRARFIPRADKAMILGKNSYAKPLMDDFLLHFARYRTLSFKALNLVNDAYVQSAVHAGFRAYIEAYEHHINTYDRAYAEFDSLHKRECLEEVDIGRDTIYAYQGRRTQDIARRRRMGVWERLRRTREGEKIGLNLKYLVYPSTFTEYVSDERKAAYLESQGITPLSNPYFLDTGYAGSVPEDIMRIIGIGKGNIREINKRIRLLSARDEARQIKNAETGNVHWIENAEKPEYMAEGLFYNPATGKIQHLAPPTPPCTQFLYQIRRLAITRHYWLKEWFRKTPF